MELELVLMVVKYLFFCNGFFKFLSVWWCLYIIFIKWVYCDFFFYVCFYGVFSDVFIIYKLVFIKWILVFYD